VCRYKQPGARKEDASKATASSKLQEHATRKKTPGARARRQERSFAVAKPALRRLAGCNVEGLVRPSVARCFAVAKPVLWRLEGCNLELARPISADPCRQQGGARQRRGVLALRQRPWARAPQDKSQLTRPVPDESQLQEDTTKVAVGSAKGQAKSTFLASFEAKSRFGAAEAQARSRFGASF